MSKKTIATSPKEKSQEVLLTAEEITARQAEEDAWSAGKDERVRVNTPADIASETNSVLIKALAKKIGLTVGDIERVK